MKTLDLMGVKWAAELSAKTGARLALIEENAPAAGCRARGGARDDRLYSEDRLVSSLRRLHANGPRAGVVVFLSFRDNAVGVG